MTTLRERMTEDLRGRNYSPRTVQCYVSMVARFVAQFGKPPARLGAEEVRLFQLKLIESKVSWSLFSQAVCALRFFYSVTLPRDFAVEHIPFAKTKKRLPVVPSADEVRRILGAVTDIKHRALLSTIYATGARLSEAVHLRVADLDGERMLVHIGNGKGAKPRMVPMSPALRELLREYWRVRRPQGYLFPGESAGAALHGTGVQKVFRFARLAARIDKPASVHTLRHGYATHLLELGRCNASACDERAIRASAAVRSSASSTVAVCSPSSPSRPRSSAQRSRARIIGAVLRVNSCTNSRAHGPVPKRDAAS